MSANVSTSPHGDALRGLERRCRPRELELELRRLPGLRGWFGDPGRHSRMRFRGFCGRGLFEALRGLKLLEQSVDARRVRALRISIRDRRGRGYRRLRAAGKLQARERWLNESESYFWLSEFGSRGLAGRVTVWRGQLCDAMGPRAYYRVLSALRAGEGTGVWVKVIPE